MRTVLAWVVGVVVFLGLLWALEKLGQTINVPMSIENEHEEPWDDADWEGPSPSLTAFGWGFYSAALFVAVRCGIALKAGSWKTSVTPKGSFQWTAWVLGLVAYGLLGGLLARVFHATHGDLAAWARFSLQGAGAVAIAFGAYTWYLRQLRDLPDLFEQFYGSLPPTSPEKGSTNDRSRP